MNYLIGQTLQHRIILKSFNTYLVILYIRGNQVGIKSKRYTTRLW